MSGRTILRNRTTPLILTLAAMLLAILVGNPAGAQDSTEESMWYGASVDGEVQIHLYFAWSSTCPHCAAAHPFIDQLAEDNPWLIVHFPQVDSGNADNVELVVRLADEIGETAQYVPAFLYCEQMKTGFGSAETTGVHLQDELVACRAHIQNLRNVQADDDIKPVDEDEPISLPILGVVDAETVSLPLFTVVLGGLDAFNPCAFFVLLFLLGLLVHARSRGRMAIIGGTFVLISGLVYLAFMAAWLNVFLLFGALPAITLIAGVVALIVAAVNIKDYFWFKRGPSLSIPEAAKPGLFRRMRGLTTSTSFPAMMIGTITLAFVANAYELLCTAGFPLVFTRVLTLNELSTGSYYLYLVLYNVVYVVPLLLIVGVFVWTLGSRKMSERTGRTLKLLSGLMMLGLGLVLLFASDLLENLLTAPLILVGALTVIGLVVLVDRFQAFGDLSSDHKPATITRRMKRPRNL
jgi:thiol-disulfide isomerase/thioredoxin